MNLKPFPHYQQLNEMDCGSTSLRIIATYYGIIVLLDSSCRPESMFLCIYSVIIVTL